MTRIPSYGIFSECLPFNEEVDSKPQASTSVPLNSQECAINCFEIDGLTLLAAR